MHLRFLSGIFVLLLLAACTNSRTTTSAPIAFTPAGEWAGTLPCADCPGIDYTLNLHAGGHYEETMIYQERSVAAVTSQGAWKLGKDSVVSLQAANSAGKQYFKFTGSELVMLDQDKKEIEAPFAGMYRLARKPEGADRATPERLARGIVFAATGNEPFWSVELDGKGQLFFNTPDGPQLTAQAVKEESAAAQQTARYSAAQNGKKLRLEIMREKCTDGMSGAVSDWAVHVVLTEEGKETSYRGCGTYMGDYRLQNIWSLQQIDGDRIDPRHYPDGVPTLELEMDGKRVSGFAGCNRYFGTFELAGQQLSFSPMGSTRMACPSTMQLESRFLEILSGQKLHYTFSAGNTLQLTGNGHTLVFGK